MSASDIFITVCLSLIGIGFAQGILLSINDWRTDRKLRAMRQAEWEDYDPYNPTDD